MNKLMAGVSAAALVAAFGAGTAHANPTLKNVKDVSYNDNVEIGTVDIDVYVSQGAEGVYGGDANGGYGGNANGGDANGSEGGHGGEGGWGGTGGYGGNGGTGGAATATNTTSISIENGNSAVISENDMYAENYLDFDDFVDTGDNDPSAEGGEANGGDGGEANGGEGNTAWAGAEGNANAEAGNGGYGGYGGMGGEGGNGGNVTSGNVTLTTGDVSYNNNAFQNAAGQFNVAANTGIANINQQGNSVAAHVPVIVDTTALGDPIPDVGI